MIRHIALTNYIFSDNGDKIKRGSIVDLINPREEKVYSKVFAPFDTTKEVNVLEIDNGDRYIIGKGVVACVLHNGKCSVVKSPLLNMEDVGALIGIAYYKAVNGIK